MNRRNPWVVVVSPFAVLLFAVCATAADPALKLVQTIPLKGRVGKLDHLALDAKNERLFVANKPNNTLDIVDLKAGKLLQQIAAQQGIQGIAYAADLDRIFVGLGQGGYCNVFDGKDYKLLKSVKFKDDSDNVSYHPKTQRVYVAHADNALGVIDAKTFEVKADIKLPAGAEQFELEMGRPRLYLNVTSLNQVVQIDTDSNKITATYPLKLAGANVPMALDEPNHRLFLGCRKPAMMVVMDTESGKEITSVPIGGEVDNLFYDAKRKRLYAVCGEGVVSIIRQIDADKYEAVEKMATEKTARTGLLDSDGGRFFVAVPRLAGKDAPEVRVYKLQP
jgi:DNA-binding beta-propeller fold protein YncE